MSTALAIAPEDFPPAAANDNFVKSETRQCFGAPTPFFATRSVSASARTKINLRPLDLVVAAQRRFDSQDQIPRRVSGPQGTLARIVNGEPTYLHNDHLGSPREMSDAAGNNAGWAHYSPFGMEIVTNLPKDQAGFTGHIKDSATGLNYMQARYYDPVIGRFLSIDPVTFMDTGEAGYFNRYAYSLNDPINRFDPDGRQSIPSGMGPGQLEIIRDIAAPITDQVYDFFVADAVDAVNSIKQGDFKQAGAAAAMAVIKPAKVTKKAKKSLNKLEPDSKATGDHTTFKTDSDGNITRHETWTKNDKNPSGFDSKQSTDVSGKAHRNKATGDKVPTPHTQGKDIPGGVRPATPDEIPKRRN